MPKRSLNTTYGALSCELAFLHSLAICFTLVVQSATKEHSTHIYRPVVMTCHSKKVGELLPGKLILARSSELSSTILSSLYSAKFLAQSKSNKCFLKCCLINDQACRIGEFINQRG